MRTKSTLLAIALAAGTFGCRSHATVGSGGDDSAQFNAENGDLVGFQSWYHAVLPEDPLSGIVYPPGQRVGYVNHRVPAGTASYPAGTIIIKAVEPPASDPQQWQLFAFAKRGGDYNAAGAIGWEFLLLRLDGDGNPYITDRGLAPANDGFDQGGTNSYSPGGAAGSCNICHGMATYAATDHIISTQMAPGH